LATQQRSCIRFRGANRTMCMSPTVPPRASRLQIFDLASPPLIFVRYDALLRSTGTWLMSVSGDPWRFPYFSIRQDPDYGAIGEDQFARIYDRMVFGLEARQFCTRLLNLRATLVFLICGNMTGSAGLDANQVRRSQFIVNISVSSCGTQRTLDYVRVLLRLRVLCEGRRLSRLIGLRHSKLNDLWAMGLSRSVWRRAHRTLVRRSECLSEIQNFLGRRVSLPKSSWMKFPARLRTNFMSCDSNVGPPISIRTSRSTTKNIPKFTTRTGD